MTTLFAQFVDLPHALYYPIWAVAFAIVFGSIAIATAISNGFRSLRDRRADSESPTGHRVRLRPLHRSAGRELLRSRPGGGL